MSKQRSVGTFLQVFETELRETKRRRKAAGLTRGLQDISIDDVCEGDAGLANRTGLAFSGGGVRFESYRQLGEHVGEKVIASLYAPYGDAALPANEPWLSNWLAVPESTNAGQRREGHDSETAVPAPQSPAPTFGADGDPFDPVDRPPFEETRASGDFSGSGTGPVGDLIDVLATGKGIDLGPPSPLVEAAMSDPLLAGLEFELLRVPKGPARSCLKRFILALTQGEDSAALTERLLAFVRSPGSDAAGILKVLNRLRERSEPVSRAAYVLDLAIKAVARSQDAPKPK